MRTKSYLLILSCLLSYVSQGQLPVEWARRVCYSGSNIRWILFSYNYNLPTYE